MPRSIYAVAYSDDTKTLKLWADEWRLAGHLVTFPLLTARSLGYKEGREIDDVVVYTGPYYTDRSIRIWDGGGEWVVLRTDPHIDWKDTQRFVDIHDVLDLASEFLRGAAKKRSVR